MTYFAPVVLRLGSSRSGEGERGCVGRVIDSLSHCTVCRARSRRRYSVVVVCSRGPSLVESHNTKNVASMPQAPVSLGADVNRKYGSVSTGEAL